MSDDAIVDARLLKRIDSEFAKKRINATTLAGITKLSQATISRFRSGKATKQTIMRICEKLNINQDGTDAVKIDIQGYTNGKEFEFYRGNYLWIRPIFDHESAIGCYPVTIGLNADNGKLHIKRFISDRRLTTGEIYINDRGYINIFSVLSGFASLTTLSSITEDGLLLGAMLCLGEVSGNMVAPTCSPVVLVRKEDTTNDIERIIYSDEKDYDYFKDLLKKVILNKFAVFKV